MRFLIKLFDREPIKNLLSATVFEPEVVVYLCDETHANLFKESAIYRYFKKKGLRTRPRFFYVDPWSPVEVRQVLRAVVQDYAGCVFDLTGGKDLLLVTAGMLAQDLNLPAFHIDIYRQRFGNVRRCEALERDFRMPQFSAEDLLAVTGAGIQGYGHIQPHQWDATLEKEVLAVFELVLKNTRHWGDFVGYLQQCCTKVSTEKLLVVAPKSIYRDGRELHYHAKLFHKLHKIGVLSLYQEKDKEVIFQFKSMLLKRCLLGVGVWLELYCYAMARQTGFFDEVLSSVVINWDGKENAIDTTRNEVDLLLVKGVMPVFISCKTGTPHAQAMYEVKQLCERFAGSFGRAVLVTAQDLGHEADAVRHRAAELRILLLDKHDIDANLVGKKMMELAKKPAPRPVLPRVEPKENEWVF